MNMILVYYVQFDKIQIFSKFQVIWSMFTGYKNAKTLPKNYIFLKFLKELLFFMIFKRFFQPNWIHVSPNFQVI